MTPIQREALQMCLEYIETNEHERRHVRWKINEALAEQPAQRNPLTDANKQFNAVIDFAITQGSQASMFLRHWREGDTAEWPEFDAYLAAHGITGEQA